MIARARTWRRSGRSVGPIDSMLGSSASPNGALRLSRRRVDPSWRQLLGRDLDDVAGPARGSRPSGSSPSAEPERRERVAHLVDRGRPLERRGDPRAAVEVDAEVEALAGDRQRADQQDHAGHREEPLRRCPCSRSGTGSDVARAPSAPGGAAGACRAASTGSPASRSTAVNSETMTPRPSVNAKPLHARRREDEQDERDQERDDVRVDDRRQALPVARR